MLSHVESFSDTLDRQGIPRRCLDVAIVVDASRASKDVAHDQERRDQLIEIVEGAIYHFSPDGNSATIYSLDGSRVRRATNIVEVATLLSGETYAYTRPTSPKLLLDAMGDGFLGNPASNRPTLVLYVTDSVGWNWQPENYKNAVEAAGTHQYFVLTISHGVYGPNHNTVGNIATALYLGPHTSAKHVHLHENEKLLTLGIIEKLFNYVPDWLEKIGYLPSTTLGETDERDDKIFTWSELGALSYEVVDEWAMNIEDHLRRQSERMRRRIGSWLMNSLRK